MAAAYLPTLEAAKRILEEAGGALQYQEIARKALQAGIWKSDAENPATIMGTSLANDVRDKGESSLFVRAGRGYYALASASERPTEDQKLSFVDAAERVLRESGAHEPLHYRDITDTALAEGYIETSGETPQATMFSVIYEENKRREKRGERPRFVRHKGGYVGLREWQQPGLAGRIDAHNKEVRQQLLAHVRSMKGDEFEKLVGRLLPALGFVDVEVTQYHGDGGIDVRGTLVVGDVIETRMAIQAKCWSRGNIQAPVVQQLRGSLGAHDQGLIITTTDFSRGATDEAARRDATPVGLMNGEKLVALLVEHRILVGRTQYSLLELDLDPREEDEEEEDVVGH